MAQDIRTVTDAELQVLEALWSQGSLSMRALAEHLYPNSAQPPVSNVQKLLERLEKKKHVLRDRSAGVQTFSAQTDRESLIDNQLLETAEKYCNGSIAPLFSRLIQAKELSKAEREELRGLIDQLDQNKPSTGSA